MTSSPLGLAPVLHFRSSPGRADFSFVLPLTATATTDAGMDADATRILLNSTASTMVHIYSPGEDKANVVRGRISACER